jgi:prepilin-type N-terminal cleavage/methylation domain-containing protein
MNKKGFTLIEVLIVIAVIGILASVVLVGLGPIQKQGRDARRISDLKQVQSGLELYYNRNGAYPLNITSWDQLVTTLTGAGVGVSNVPKDPNPSQSYQYVSSGSSYCLGAQLEDSNNPAWKNSTNANPCDQMNCYDGKLYSSNPPSQGQLYCVSL